MCACVRVCVCVCVCVGGHARVCACGMRVCLCLVCHEGPDSDSWIRDRTLLKAPTNIKVYVAAGPRGAYVSLYEGGACVLLGRPDSNSSQPAISEGTM